MNHKEYKDIERCPFCGSYPYMRTKFCKGYQDIPPHWKASISCNACGCTVQFASQNKYELLDDTINTWNSYEILRRARIEQEKNYLGDEKTWNG